VLKITSKLLPSAFRGVIHAEKDKLICFSERLPTAVYLHKVVPALVGTFHSEIPIYGYNSAQQFFARCCSVRGILHNV
jgi:hypothetical protein